MRSTRHLVYTYSVAYLVNKLEILQPILNNIEPGWQIEKPVNPCDVEPDCVFQHKVGPREVKVNIDNDLFQHGKLEEIEKLVRRALESVASPTVKVLIELTTKQHEFLLNQTTEESPVYFRLKNAVKNDSGSVDILCFPDEAEMLLRVSKTLHPEVALKIEQAIRSARAS